ncbi:MAG TPA: tyrosine-type recombinase/integrase [Phycisphaerae bacterium]|nr:tyrosine-type recombinase/integrase [Phycisphaerae bacterium]
MNRASSQRRLDTVNLGNVTIFKHQNGIWYADYRAGNRRIRKSIRTRSKKVAVDWGTNENARLMRGELGIVDGRVSIDRTIDEFLDFQEHQTSNAPSTVRRYRCALRALRAVLRQCPSVRWLGQIDVALLEKFRRFRLEQGRDHTTIDGDMAAVSSFLGYAVRHGYCKDNVASKVKAFRVPKPRPYMYSAEEVAAMFAEAEGVLRDVITLLVDTGLRIGEVEQLEWTDMDFDAGLIHVRIKPHWRPKDKADRAIPMTGRVRAMLQSKSRTGNRVFYTNRGRPVRERTLLAELRCVQRRAGISRGGLHTFRHYFVSRCAASGVDPFTCMAWVGHADMKMVMHYYHLDERHSRASIAKLSS